MMENVVSVSTNFFVMVAVIANRSAPNSTSSAAGWKASIPGRRITSTPAEQAASAMARVMVMRSPRNKIASKATHAGVVNSRAKTVASGKITIATVQQICETKWTTFRVA